MARTEGWVRRLTNWLNGIATSIEASASKGVEERRAKALSDFETETARVFRWPEHDDVLPVVGESYYQAELRCIVGDHGDKSIRKELTALLRPESDNPHDDKALSVWIEGLKVGHLSSDDARSFRRRLSAKKMTGQTTACTAMVMGGHKLASGERASYGVQLFLKSF